MSGVAGQSVPDGAYYLGRPWRDYSRVVFQSTSMSAVVNPAGWRAWSSNDAPPDTVFYAEYANSGDGYVPDSRPSSVTILSSAVTVEEVLGSGYAGEAYFDQEYFSG